MAAGRSCGGSLDEITWHYYLTVKKALFNNNKAHKGNKFVTLRGIIVMDAAIFFPYSTFEGCFPRSAGNP